MRLLELLPRPLDPVRSIKLKLSIVLLGSGAVGVAYLWWQYRWLPPYLDTTVTVALVLLSAQVLAHGMTSPLREMTAAARAMARGDYTRRVRATTRDEVGQLAGAFNQMAAELATADQRRRELIAGVSHELRTPIAALCAVLENAVDGVGDPPADVLPVALAHSERLARLVTDFLELSRVDAGVHTLRRAEFPARTLLDEAVASVAPSVGRGPVDTAARFRVRVVPQGLTLCADRARLRQVLVNLLDNAVRHGPADGTIELLVRLDGDRQVIEVRDDGPGIPPELRDQVFRRFTRGERAGDGGTGLGLAIARWVVELHGGQITVTDPPPNPTGPAGCVVRVSLPSTPGSDR